MFSLCLRLRLRRRLRLRLLLLLRLRSPSHLPARPQRPPLHPRPALATASAFVSISFSSAPTHAPPHPHATSSSSSSSGPPRFPPLAAPPPIPLHSRLRVRFPIHDGVARTTHICTSARCSQHGGWSIREARLEPGSFARAMRDDAGVGADAGEQTDDALPRARPLGATSGIRAMNVRLRTPTLPSP
ncbi:hypothetical protein B0H15DRAFT_818144 [Mycena belliarum]|uniref:Uncharacterized protein n=1 Tax=Mycena belliarum TaxID=1033014 RepID=A0AAD6UI37_9AGAR|nr:hypothetical protein B0H15DRAFT_818144 [Mycena belliae]